MHRGVKTALTSCFTCGIDEQYGRIIKLVGVTAD